MKARLEQNLRNKISAPGVVENKNEFHQQIWATSKLLKFGSLVFVEKDFYVTQIIHILSQIKNPH